MSSRLRVGLVGSGYIAGVHAASIISNPKLKLTKVYSLSRQRREAFAERFGCRTAAGLDEILEASDIDAVVVASSTDTHSEIAIRAARAKKPIYCEKPIDLDLTRAKATVDALANVETRLMYGFNRRYHPSHGAVQQDVQAGKIGQLQLLQMRSRGGESPPTPEYIKTSGGIIRDKGVHFFDMIRFITNDEPVEVFAVGSSLAHPFIGELEDYDTFAATLRLRSGVICHIDNTRTSPLGYDERIEAFGTTGMIESIGVPKTMIVRMAGKSASYDRFPRSNLERVGESFPRAMETFAHFADGKDVRVPTIADAFAAQLISEAAVISASEGRCVLIADLEDSLK